MMKFLDVNVLLKKELEVFVSFFNMFCFSFKIIQKENTRLIFF